MTRQRWMTLTAGSAAMAALMMVFFFKAPVVPVAIGAVIGVGLLLWRKPGHHY
jgi:hypothetical protein